MSCCAPAAPAPCARRMMCWIPCTLHPGGTELEQEGVMLDELTPNARTVLAELGPKAQTADDLAAATGLAVQAVLAALMELEFAGRRRG